MRLVDGTTLADVVAELHAVSPPDAWGTTAGGWTFRRVVDAYRRACEALGYAHRRGVMHRDLTPCNVMVGEMGEVLVMDWGLARRVDAASMPPPASVVPSGSWQGTQFGDVMGTPGFMPPEQVKGHLDRIGPATDVFALGAVLYRVLTGRSPYTDVPGNPLMRVLGGPPTPIEALAGASAERLPKALCDLSRRCMAHDPAERPADGGEVAEAVRA
jgi:serine/threonine protein kinase